MTASNYAWVGLIAAVPIVILFLALILRGYDVTIILKKKQKGDD
jgi:hypothetical protein